MSSNINKFVLIIVLLQILMQCIVCFHVSHHQHISRNSLLKMAFMTHYEELPVKTKTGTSLIDITQQIADIVKTTGCKEGVVTVLSKHSTVGIIIQG